MGSTGLVDFMYVPMAKQPMAITIVTIRIKRQLKIAVEQTPTCLGGFALHRWLSLEPRGGQTQNHDSEFLPFKERCLCRQLYKRKIDHSHPPCRPTGDRLVLHGGPAALIRESFVALCTRSSTTSVLQLPLPLLVIILRSLSFRLLLRYRLPRTSRRPP